MKKFASLVIIAIFTIALSSCGTVKSAGKTKLPFASHKKHCAGHCSGVAPKNFLLSF